MKKILITIILLTGLNQTFAGSKIEKATAEMGTLIEKEVTGLDGGLEDNNFFETKEAVSPFNFSGFEGEFNGLSDHIRVWDRVLTQEEITIVAGET